MWLPRQAIVYVTLGHRVGLSGPWLVTPGLGLASSPVSVCVEGALFPFDRGAVLLEAGRLHVLSNSLCSSTRHVESRESARGLMLRSS